MGRFTQLHHITNDSAIQNEWCGIHIPKSLKFDYPSRSTYLYKGFGGGSTRKWTISVWVKNWSVGEGGMLIGRNTLNPNVRETCSMSGGRAQIAWQLRAGGSQHVYRKSTYTSKGTHMDHTGWVHIVMQWDSNNGTTADRWIVYANNVRQSQNQYNATHQYSNSNVFSSSAYIGRAADTASNVAEFYLAEYHGISDAKLDPTHFGFTDPDTGIWRPKSPAVVKANTTYNAGSWYLDFSDSSNIGTDRSGLGNHWSANNFSATDVVDDTPTNNFCILDNNDHGGNHAKNGNLQSGTAGTSGWRHIRGTHILFKGSGRWYWECKQKGNIDGSNGAIAGLRHVNYGTRTQDPNGNSGYMYARQGDTRYWNGGNAAGHFPSTSNNDIIQFAFDANTGKIWSGTNNTWTGANPSTGTSHSMEINYTGSGGDVCPFVGQYGSNNYWEVNFGQNSFVYTPPTGFRAICSKNFEIEGPTVIKPKKHFDILTYTGNGSNGHVRTGLEFKPDLVWFKCRSTTHNHDLYDSVRGANKRLIPNGTDAETSYSNLVQSFNDNGVTLGTANEMNQNSQTYVAWCWKAGDGTETNTDGTISSTVSVNKAAGFSIVSYTGTEVNNSTVGHGLGKAPTCVIIKDRDSNSAGNNWYVWHKELNTANYIKLNDNSGQAAVSGTSNGGVGSVTATTFNFIQGTSGNNKNVNENGDEFIAYCWTDIPGYSKMGIFTGNSAGGTVQPGGKVIKLGFKPALVILKATSSFSGSNWGMFDFRRDGSNGPTHDLRANVNNSEGGDDYQVELQAEGFRISTTSSGFGGSAAYTYIYMAWAEAPGRLPYDIAPTQQ